MRMVELPKYLALRDHYESRLREFGDSHQGMDWPNADDAESRYRVMTEVEKFAPAEIVQKPTILDFGCGASHLYAYILSLMPDRFAHYQGVDISDEMIKTSRYKYPDNSYICADIMMNSEKVPSADFVIANGLFTEKLSMTYDEMWEWVQEMLNLLFQKANVGLACNFMSKHVDWERDDLFHLPFDVLTSFATRHLSRCFVIRSDYGLYEYTIYIYKDQ